MNTVNTTRRAINKSKKPSYKPTLDVQHNAFVSTIEDMHKKRHSLQEECRDIDNKIKSIELQMREVDFADDSIIQTFTCLKDRRIEIQSELKKIEADFDEKAYYTNTASILFEYYDLVEKGTTHSEIDKPVPPPKPTVTATTNILDYFKGTAVKPKQTTTSEESKKNDTSKDSSNANTPKQGHNTNSRGALLTKYMKYTDPEYTKHEFEQSLCSEECCVHCGSNKLMVMTNDGYSWCSNCDAIEYIIIDHEKPSYRDPPKEISFFAYKRQNHLNEWISQIQGKETTDIPEEVYDKILMEIKKRKITNMAELTQKKVKSILKTLQIHKYYEHTAHIINRLTGMPMKQLSPELEEQLRHMFKLIQTPFLKHAPRSRKNFLSYSFVLHKLVQLLGHDEYLDVFPLLKSRDKLYEQDIVWRKICDELNWEFYPSL